MVDQQNQIEQDIERHRGRLQQNLQELEGKFREAVDWKGYVRRYPWGAAGVAFGAGILAARAIKGGSRSSSYSSSSGFTSSSDYAAESARAYEGGTSSGVATRWGAIGTALASVANNKLHEMLNEFVPGFREEFQRQGASSHSDSSSRDQGYTTGSAYSESGRQGPWGTPGSPAGTGDYTSGTNAL